MKNVSIRLIRFYQIFPLRIHGMCRFYPTCSEYAVTAIERYGFAKGWKLAIKRIMRCRPLGGRGYDPVPVKDD